MKSSLRGTLAAATAALAIMVTTATPAYAINGVPCPPLERSEFLEIQNDGRLCFANGGIAQVAIYGVKFISTGNNRVRFSFQRQIGGIVEWGQIDYKWVAYVYNPPLHQITSIQIY
ncbi:beta/gamma crystallin domain-containing protein [Nonomuraea sp. NPDC050202]|uniref:beta/gamma crystallin domain-containing protein n=1 Tax=Nonomuraea sp. NPDC050202 TaxID=3155035 RepID=UPI0033C68698